MHEHQRPDAADFVQIDWEALPGYEEAKQSVLHHIGVDPTLPAGAETTIEQKMKIV